MCTTSGMVLYHIHMSRIMTCKNSISLSVCYSDCNMQGIHSWNKMQSHHPPSCILSQIKGDKQMMYKSLVVFAKSNYFIWYNYGWQLNSSDSLAKIAKMSIMLGCRILEFHFKNII